MIQLKKGGLETAKGKRNMSQEAGESQIEEPVQTRASTREGLRTWQERLVQGMLRAIAIVGLLVAAVATYGSYANQELWTIPFYWGSYGVVILLTRPK